MNDVAGMKAMLAGVFAKAAEAKGKAVRRPAAPEPRAPAAPSRHAPSSSAANPAVRLDVGQGDGAAEAVGSASNRAAGTLPGLDGRLDAAMQVMARDLGRLLAAFGGEDGATDAVLRAFASRFGAEDRRAAAAMLDGAPAGAVVAVQGIEVTLGPGVPPSVRFDRAILSMEHPPGEAPAQGLAAMLGALRSAMRSSPGLEPGLTIRADSVDADALDRLTTALGRTMTAPPPRLEGWLEGQAILSPCGAATVDDGALSLSLDLKAALPPSAAGPVKAAGEKAASEKAASEKAVGETMAGDKTREQGFDVRI